jgi:hypothetical protein
LGQAGRRQRRAGRGGIDDGGAFLVAGGEPHGTLVQSGKSSCVLSPIGSRRQDELAIFGLAHDGIPNGKGVRTLTLDLEVIAADIADRDLAQAAF